jgi:hypothetical protein
MDTKVNRTGMSKQKTNFYKLLKKKWSTTLKRKRNQELMQLKPIKMNKGLLQGDSLTPLIF